MGMDILVNYWAIVGGAVFLLAVGMVWYGPLFSRQWMKIVGAESMSKEDMAQAQKEMMPMYVIQFILSLVTSYVLYFFVKGWAAVSGVEAGFWVWLGFAMPVAAGAMWDTRKGLKMRKFLIVAGYQLVTLIILGWAFGAL
jgi:hypothetical protein